MGASDKRGPIKITPGDRGWLVPVTLGAPRAAYANPPHRVEVIAVHPDGQAKVALPDGSQITCSKSNLAFTRPVRRRPPPPRAGRGRVLDLAPGEQEVPLWGDDREVSR